MLTQMILLIRSSLIRSSLIYLSLIYLSLIPLSLPAHAENTAMPFELSYAEAEEAISWVLTQ